MNPPPPECPQCGRWFEGTLPAVAWCPDCGAFCGSGAEPAMPAPEPANGAQSSLWKFFWWVFLGTPFAALAVAGSGLLLQQVLQPLGTAVSGAIPTALPYMVSGCFAGGALGSALLLAKIYAKTLGGLVAATLVLFFVLLLAYILTAALLMPMLPSTVR